MFSGLTFYVLMIRRHGYLWSKTIRPFFEVLPKRTAVITINVIDNYIVITNSVLSVLMHISRFVNTAELEWDHEN